MIRVTQLKLPIQKETELRKAVCRVLHIKDSDLLEFYIVKRSIDARKKENICYIYTVDCKVAQEDKVMKAAKGPSVTKADAVCYTPSITGNQKFRHRPVIVGSGPAGIFCGYLLAKNGYCPLIIERGEPVDERAASIEKFWKQNILNEESNVVFGEGGAGTFSDGKLNTMVKDSFGRIHEVLKIFTAFGAPSDILYLNKPHIGTDYLRMVIKNIRNEIITLGGEVRFGTKLSDIKTENGVLKSIVTTHKGKTEGNEIFFSQENIPCELLVLATGHSARDTFAMLEDKGISMEAKAFAVGVRIEHEQEFIGRAQYGDSYLKLPPADYKLTHRCANGRGVYSFCMCPGGFVVNASSEKNRLTINGMSNYRRDEKNANSALIVTVNPEDFMKETKDFTPLSGIRFQRKFEELAYAAGKGSVPVQLYGDFKRGQESISFGHITPCMKGSYQLANLRNCLPDYVADSILEGMTAFHQTIPGFAHEEAVLSGVEMRTSSPVRILRNETMEGSIKGLYPCGEGAGYAGGIMSAAIDGMKVFEAIIKKYQP